MSLVAMARATSTTTMPTFRDKMSSFGGLPPIAILASRAHPTARTETTALWYTSILPSIVGDVMVLLHIVGVGESLQLGRFILDFERGGLPPPTWDWRASACFRPQKTYANETPARQTAPMIHWIQLWLCFGRLFVCSRSGICRPVPEKRADVPSESAALTCGRNDSLAA